MSSPAEQFQEALKSIAPEGSTVRAVINPVAGVSYHFVALPDGRLVSIAETDLELRQNAQSMVDLAGTRLAMAMREVAA